MTFEERLREALDNSPVDALVTKEHVDELVAYLMTHLGDIKSTWVFQVAGTQRMPDITWGEDGEVMWADSMTKVDFPELERIGYGKWQHQTTITWED